MPAVAVVHCCGSCQTCMSNNYLGVRRCLEIDLPRELCWEREIVDPRDSFWESHGRSSSQPIWKPLILPTHVGDRENVCPPNHWSSLKVDPSRTLTLPTGSWSSWAILGITRFCDCNTFQIAGFLYHGYSSISNFIEIMKLSSFFFFVLL